MSEPVQGRRGINWHGFTSMTTMTSFIVMTVTGLILIIVPEGRLANWVDWHILGLTKGQWGDIHLTSSLVFTIVGFIHIWYNWRQFMAYLRRRFQQRVQIRPEAWLATLFLVVVVVGTLYKVPPFSNVMDFSTATKDSWSVDPAMEPPFGHAEEVTLKTMGLRTATSPDAIIAAMRDAGWKVEGPQQTMLQIADANGTSPSVLWAAVQKRVPSVLPEPVDAQAAWTPQSVEERFTGKGYGAKQVGPIATELGLPVDAVIAKLGTVATSASPSDKLKDVAERAKTTPTELLKFLLVKDYTLPHS